MKKGGPMSRLKTKFSLVPRAEVALWSQLATELEQSVEPSIETHWSLRIAEGIIPNEEKLQGPVDGVEHIQKEVGLAVFEARIILDLFEKGLLPTYNDPDRVEAHYVGIGNARGLEKVTPVFNERGYNVIAYDTTSVACDNARKVFDRLINRAENETFLADIYTACQKRYMNPDRAVFLILSRVLEVLNKQQRNWDKVPPEQRKMARVLRRIGKLRMPVLMIYPCPEDNKHVVWGDGNPLPLLEVVGYMEEGARRELEPLLLGTTAFYSRTYSAIFIDPNKH